ncbi:hypothetical protein LSCM4_04442 [Leishmania orientalis]|uniref:Uncharacterized protein n=1 Tax=Leishmania orientalis TaxID=2249476 RepID=A0A836GNR8_9TRYP|nr:hypothetical protein LSCM4_04442 [Leishmania orientalis]
MHGGRAIPNINDVGKVDRRKTNSPRPLLRALTLEQQATAYPATDELDATIAHMSTPDGMASLAEESEDTTRSPIFTTATSKSNRGTHGSGNANIRKKRGAAALVQWATDVRKVTSESAEESTLVTSPTMDSVEHGATSTRSSSQGEADEPHKRRADTGREDERPERNLPTAASVLTRRAKTGKAEGTAVLQQEKSRHDGDGGAATSRLERPKEVLGGVPLHEVRGSRSRSHSTAPQTPTGPNATPACSLSALGAKQEEEEAWETAVQVAIDAQERQLLHTLLSIFPPEVLRDSESERCLAKEWGFGVSAEPSDAKSAHDAPSRRMSTGSLPSPSLSPEPLTPLLKALCEDKAYVHGAWCRYEDDLAVRRTQNSIQRKRQRHSFNKGARKAVLSKSTAAARCGGGDGDDDESSADEDDAMVEDELQPPQSLWIEAPPAFTGGPRLLPANATRPAPAGAVTGGFQWTPWRFYREKRRRSSRRPTEGGASSSAARPTTVAGVVQSDPSSAAPSKAAASGSGVPSLAFSDVPSLPVLQVETAVPKSAAAVVSPMTPEERKGYARYVMSSGKLRHDCRDPYTFLVSRAKEMRIQWERQHPMDGSV